MARLPLILFAVLVLFLAIGLGLNPQQLPSPLLNKPAPSMTLPDLYDTQRQHHTQDWGGEAWVLTVWASWCSTCVAEHQVLQALQQAMPNLRLVGLVYKDSPEAAQQWLGKHGNPYRHLLLDAEGKAGIDWGVYGVPETFVMDRQGIVRHKITGALTMTELTQTLLPLLQKLP